MFDNKAFEGRVLPYFHILVLATTAVALLFWTVTAYAANRYWVGPGNNSTEWEDLNNWSANSKGAGGASLPGASDVAVFDGTGGTVQAASNINIGGLIIHQAWTGSVKLGTGTTTIGGTGIRVGSGRLIAQGGVVSNSGSYTQTGGTVTIQSLSLSGSFSITNVNPTTAVFTSTGTVRLNNAAADQTFTQQGNISTTFTTFVLDNSGAGVVDDIILSGSGLSVTTLTISQGNLDGSLNNVAITVSGNTTLADAAQATLTTDANVTMGGNITVNDSASFRMTGATLTLNGTADQTVDLDGQSIFNLTLNNTGGGTSDDIIINGGSLNLSGALLVTLGNLDLATNDQPMVVDGGITLANAAQATLTTDANVTASGTVLVNDSATITVTGGTWTLKDDGNQLVDFDGQALSGVTLNLPTSGTDVVTVVGTLDVNGDLTITQGELALGGNTLDIESALTIANDGDATLIGTGTLTVAGNITKNVSGGLSLTGSTLTLDGTNQTLSGSITYNNLTKKTNTATLTFAAGTTHTMKGTLTLSVVDGGGGTNFLKLRSSQNGTQVTMAPAAVAVAWLDVQDNAVTGLTVTCTSTCKDSGNNSGWTFVSTTIPSTTSSGGGGSGGGGGSRRAANVHEAIAASNRITVATESETTHAAADDSLPHVMSRLQVKIDGKDVVLKDVRIDEWYAEYVYDLVKANIVSGYRDARGRPTGQYGPSNSVTYGEIAKIAVQAAGIPAAHSAPKNRTAQDEWSSEYVAALEAANVSVFTDNIHLNVNAPAPRGAVVQVLLEAFGTPIRTAEGGYYSDVSASTKYAGAIETATEAEIVSGDDNANTFRPSSAVNRAETAKIVKKVTEAYGG